MRIPTIHLNGTSAQELRKQLVAAVEAIRVAQDKIMQAMPHGRDYYVQDGFATGEAQQEMRVRCAKLEEVKQELVTIHHGIVEQEVAVER